MSIMLTIIAIIYTAIGFYIHQKFLQLKKEDDDELWDDVDKNAWWVEMLFLLCALFWPFILLIAVLKKEKE